MEGIPGAPDSGNSLVQRAKAILLKPSEEWAEIAQETTSPGDIFTRYALPLIAIGPIATLIGGQIFGFGALGISFKPSLMGGVTTAVVSFVMAIVSLVAITFIADILAPKFGGEAHRPVAFRLVAYSLTASWVAGIFGLIPSLGILGLLGLYSLYLFYVGATPLLKVPQDKAVGFTAVTTVCAILLTILVSMVSASVIGVFGAGAALTSATSDGEISGKLSIPGVGSVDVDKMEDATKQMEDAANGETTAVEPSALQALLPASVGAYARTAVESTKVGGMGSQAEGTYEAGDNRFRLKVTDMAALGALAGLGSAMGVEQSREDADGYERTGTVDGQMRTEKWDKGNSSGSYGVMVANRFMIEADGRATSIDELKAAVATINQSTLAGLAK